MLLFLSLRRAAAAILAAACCMLVTPSLLAAPSANSPAFAAYDDSEDQTDPVIVRFSTVGDSRQDPISPDPTTLPLSGQDAIWLQNTKAFSRILRSIEAQRANFLFFNGDMIMGYGKAGLPTDVSSVDKIVRSDLMNFYRQYGFWRGMVAPTMETGTYVVPVPGNHETQCSTKVSADCTNGNKKSLVENEIAWRANMGDLILDDARFGTILGTPPSFKNIGNNASADSLSTDQSKLSYSFDYGNTHFAVINTDPVGKEAHAPTNWLRSDLAAAQSRGMQHFFVFGHKPAFTYYYGKTTPLPTSSSGLDNDTNARDAFWQVVADFGAIYFCGHEHIFNIAQFAAPSGATAWQVMVGSGGSPFEATPTDSTLNPQTDRDYAWATVKVNRSGRVQLTAYGFDDQYGQTRVLRTMVLAR